MFDRAFQEILYRIDNWINEGSGWILKRRSVCEYFYLQSIQLPNKLKNSMKGPINIKNNNNKYFLCCHIRYLNPLEIHPQRITKVDKK